MGSLVSSAQEDMGSGDSLHQTELDIPDSGTMRNKFLLFLPTSLQYSVGAAPTDEELKEEHFSDREFSVNF